MPPTPRSSAAFALAALLAFAGAAFGQSQPPGCVAGTSQTFSATGAIQTYPVPPGTTALLITATTGGSGARGAAGTRIWSAPSQLERLCATCRQKTHTCQRLRLDCAKVLANSWERELRSLPPLGMEEAGRLLRQNLIRLLMASAAAGDAPTMARLRGIITGLAGPRPV